MNGTALEGNGKVALLAGSLLVVALLIGLLPLASDVLGGRYDRNDTAITRLNITNTRPTVYNVLLQDNITETPRLIDLQPETTIPIWCNGTVEDYNGYADINTTNATIWSSTVSIGSADNLNSHYSNSSCARITGTGTTSDYSCRFDLPYFALNGTWYCNMSAIDQLISGEQGFGSNLTSTNISELIALNVTDIIDFGSLQAGQTSASDSNATIYNLGNVQIDLNLHGYGAADGDNLAMVCSIGNIPVFYEHYNLTTWNQNFDTLMANLTGPVAGVTHSNFDLPKALSWAGRNSTTYWKIGLPIGAARGLCNGTVVFNAVVG
jgi:hypothetical protein